MSSKAIIRNFCILAHVDHGKSTLADRLLEITGTIEKRKMHAQFLDANPLEREKGITIKMQPVRMHYELRMKNQEAMELYVLNLIDTPGHVDFSYEVSRALAAVESAIILVDATQGIQAQTIANIHLAERERLTLIPAINKIDLPAAQVEETKRALCDFLGVMPETIAELSAKTGAGVAEFLADVVRRTPPPRAEGESDALRALVFDSLFDAYQGVIAYVRIMRGTARKNARLTFLATNTTFEALETGVFLPQRSPVQELREGEIGYIATGIKEPEHVRVGDTITGASEAASGRITPLPGYREPEPMVYASLFPENQDDYEAAREALKKLKLNDAAFTFEPEESSAIGRGFRAGFLGMLHMEIVAERIHREYNQQLIFTNPSVSFRVTMQPRREGEEPEERIIYSPAHLPPAHEFRSIEEPWVRLEIITPPSSLGSIHRLITERGGRLQDTTTLAGDRIMLRFEAPLREIIVDFHDQLKSVSQGFASMAYERIGYRPGNLLRMDILVAGERVNAFSEIIPAERVYHIARARLAKLKELLPPKLFAIALQAEVGGRIIARETISALRKDVTGYLYGGDRSRKMKLWKKQKKGKKRLQENARVEIPPDVFLKMMRE